jgi:hypothetical protein
VGVWSTGTDSPSSICRFDLSGRVDANSLNRMEK